MIAASAPSAFEFRPCSTWSAFQRSLHVKRRPWAVISAAGPAGVPEIFAVRLDLVKPSDTLLALNLPRKRAWRLAQRYRAG